MVDVEEFFYYLHETYLERVLDANICMSVIALRPGEEKWKYSAITFLYYIKML